MNNNPPCAYDGQGTANLIGELERRLVGTSPSPGLHQPLSKAIPNARAYLLVVFDGLGDHQLSHPAARTLRNARRGALQAPFPTTTTVGLSTIATGVAPLEHGTIGYKQWFPAEQTVGNVLQWRTTDGRTLRTPPEAFLPVPNLWERLAERAALGSVAVPDYLQRSPFTRAIHRGADRHHYATARMLNSKWLIPPTGPALTQVYFDWVDMAAHSKGQQSDVYTRALAEAALVWTHLRNTLPADCVMVGTADHGHVDILPSGKRFLTRRDTAGFWCSGDNRAMMLAGGTQRAAERLAAKTGGRLMPADRIRHWWGTGREHPEIDERLPDWVLLAADGTAVFAPHDGTHGLVGYHGGVTPKEKQVPLLVAEHSQ